MKYFVWTLMLSLLVLLTGCGKERIADIATPEEIDNKTILVILPSIPEQFCYADRMTGTLDELAVEINGTNPQVLSIPENIDCSHYGFYNCTIVDLGVGEMNNPLSMVECLSNDEHHVCLFLLGNEYRDVEGDTFDETCILGLDTTVE